MIDEQYARNYINIVGENNPAIKGYAKYEMMNRNNIISINLIGLKRDETYRVYLILARDSNIMSKELGTLNIVDNRGYLQTQNSLPNANIIAVVDSQNNIVAMGYRQNKISNWMQKFIETISPKEAPEPEPVQEQEQPVSPSVSTNYPEKLVHLFDQNFESFCPFGDDCQIKWWRVNSLSKLLDILTTLKYHHCIKFIFDYTKNTLYDECIVGIDNDDNKNYLVCGISPIDDQKDRPDDMECVWQSGYWIAGIVL